MAATTSPTKFSGLAHALVQSSRLQEADAEAIQSQASIDGLSFVTKLVQSKKMSALEVAEFAAHTFGFPLLDLAAIDVDPLQKDLLDAKLTQSRRVLALQKRGNRLFIATSDPANLHALDDVRFKTSLTVEPVVVMPDTISK